MAHTSNIYIYQLFALFVLSIAVKTSENASNFTSLMLKNSNVTITSSKTVAAKIDTTHQGREHITNTPKLHSSTPLPKIRNQTKQANQNGVPTKNMSTPTNSSLSIKPSSLITNATKIESSTQTATKVNITTPKPKKPERTEHDEIELPVAQPDKYVTNIAHIDSTMDKKARRADYIVPIVAVILSVPLVAIIISVLYKRGKDWWQHRNYRRMDFLIEGIYNS